MPRRSPAAGGESNSLEGGEARQELLRAVDRERDGQLQLVAAPLDADDGAHAVLWMVHLASEGEGGRRVGGRPGFRLVGEVLGDPGGASAPGAVRRPGVTGRPAPGDGLGGAE